MGLTILLVLVPVDFEKKGYILDDVSEIYYLYGFVPYVLEFSGASRDSGTLTQTSTILYPNI